MHTTPAIPPVWRPRAFTGLHLFALALLASWLWPPTHAWWDAADLALFRFLNGSLDDAHPVWAAWWAVTSLRLFDAGVGLLLLGLLIREDVAFPAGGLRAGLLSFVALLIVLLVVRVLFTKLAGVMGWQHASPSLQVPGALQLSGRFPLLERWFNVKDSSGRSFPGDHASVLALWAVHVARSARWRQGVLAALLAAALMLPRLVAGAHWLSDDVVGGGVLVALSLAWTTCTPLGAWLTRGLAVPAAWGFRLAGALPAVNRLAIVREGRGARPVTT